MDTIFSLKNSCEDFEVEYDIISSPDKNRAEIADGLKNVDDLMALNQSKIDEMNSEIDRLTNHADGLDYMVAVASGVLTGLLDAFVVGEFSFEEGKKWGEEQVNEFVVRVAKSQGYTGDDLYGAVKYMEGKFPIVADKVTNDFGGGLQHHLRDFSHHPTPVGLFFSFLTQFTKKAYGADVAGVFKIVDIKETDWILIGESIPEKFTFGVINWFFYMVSDVAGSLSSILEGKSGTGLPGPIVSLLKEVSALPIFRNMNKSGYKEFSVWISKLFNGTLLVKKILPGELLTQLNLT